MNYRIKNIENWRQFLPMEEKIKNWKNDEVHTIDPLLAEHGVNFGCIDPIHDKSMEEEELEKNPPKPKCPLCGKECKNQAGLKAHLRKCTQK